MATRIIILPHTHPPSRIIYENNFERVLAAIANANERAITALAQQVVTEAQATGSYQNRTGNLRRHITSNAERATRDDPRRDYPAAPVRVTEADGTTHTRQQYQPPADFDKTTVLNRKNEWAVRVGAIMHYAQAREAAGDQVLTAAALRQVQQGERFLHEKIKVTLLSSKVTKKGQP